MDDNECRSAGIESTTASATISTRQIHHHCHRWKLFTCIPRLHHSIPDRLWLHTRTLGCNRDWPRHTVRRRVHGAGLTAKARARCLGAQPSVECSSKGGRSRLLRRIGHARLVGHRRLLVGCRGQSSRGSSSPRSESLPPSGLLLAQFYIAGLIWTCGDDRSSIRACDSAVGDEAVQ